MAASRGQRLPFRRKAQDTATINVSKYAETGIEKKTFSIVFSLSEAPETESFVARQKELGEIHSTLGYDKGSRRAITLQGLGGIGKTQLSIAYAKAHRNDYSAIFWLNVKDEISVKQSYARIAKRIVREHPSFAQGQSIADNKKLEEVVDAVKGWLEDPQNTQWLMIFDNYDSPGTPDIRQFIPDVYHGSVIVTTRSSKVKIGRRLHISKFENEQDSLQILADASHRPDALTDPAAAELAKELDGLPLALATAGAYLDQMPRNFTFSDYIRFYRTSWLKLQETSPEVLSYEDRQLYTTWQLSLDHVMEKNQNSAKLLQFWAYFDNQDLWFELLREGRRGLAESNWLCQVTEDELCFNEAMRVLCDHGLVEVDMSSRRNGFSIHHCVHSWTMHVLNRQWNHSLAGLALDCVARNYLCWEHDTVSWAIQQRLLRHAERCLDHFFEGKVYEDTLNRSLFCLAGLYADQQRFEASEKIHERILKIQERIYGPSGLFTLDTLESLACLYVETRRYEEAEKLFWRVFQSREATQGTEHEMTLRTMGNLATTCQDMNDSEKLFQRLIPVLKKSLEPDHPTMILTLTNLSLLYRQLGRCQEAEELIKQLLQASERSGPQNLVNLELYHLLGNVYDDMGEDAQAEEMYKRSLDGLRKTIGFVHVQTLHIACNLANLFHRLRRLPEAEELYQETLQGYEQILGRDNKASLVVCHQLGWVYFSLGKLAEAEPMLHRALNSYSKRPGNSHDDLIDVVSVLGDVYAGLGKHEEAARLYNQALLDDEARFGVEHKLTIETISKLGSDYLKFEKASETDRLYVRTEERELERTREGVKEDAGGVKS